jgi:hypothetical protein
MADQSKKPHRMQRATKTLPVVKLELEQEYANLHEKRPRQKPLKRGTKTLGRIDFEMENDKPDERKSADKP